MRVIAKMIKRVNKKATRRFKNARRDKIVMSKIISIENSLLITLITD